MVCTANDLDANPIINEVIGKATDVPPGTKKVFSVKGKPILVINDNGFFYATSGICSHYNFSLENGIYSQGKIRCPLHGACFNVKTGDIEDFPGFDSLNTYDVKEVDGNLVLNTTEQQLANSRRTRKSNLHAPNNDAPIIVIGGGDGLPVSAEPGLTHDILVSHVGPAKSLQSSDWEVQGRRFGVASNK
ncbi:hypothetical protein RB195_014617 [Necator americanus]|uniref:Rieske domain-containing protein n=1 Tax=Necator americanus TaxID=51031 RepID=A0ABR1E0X1_NECAM